MNFCFIFSLSLTIPSFQFRFVGSCEWCVFAAWLKCHEMRLFADKPIDQFYTHSMMCDCDGHYPDGAKRKFRFQAIYLFIRNRKAKWWFNERGWWPRKNKIKPNSQLRLFLELVAITIAFIILQWRNDDDVDAEHSK